MQTIEKSRKKTKLSFGCDSNLKVYFVLKKRNWDSHQIRLNNHFQVWSYEKEEDTDKEYIRKLNRKNSKMTKAN